MGHFVVEDLVINQMRESIQQVVALFALALSQHHHILWRLVEAIAADRPYIVVIGFSFLFGAIASRSDLLQLLICLSKDLIHFIGITVDFLSLVTDINKLERGRPEVLLQLTHITSLTEQSFGCRTELIFKNLLALKIGTLGTLHELVTIVFITHFQVIKCVE